MYSRSHSTVHGLAYVSRGISHAAERWISDWKSVSVSEPGAGGSLSQNVDVAVRMFRTRLKLKLKNPNTFLNVFQSLIVLSLTLFIDLWHSQQTASLRGVIPGGEYDVFTTPGLGGFIVSSRLVSARVLRLAD